MARRNIMGHVRKYIRNLALSLMAQLKVDQQIFNRWENFPPVITPSQAISMHCGETLMKKLMRMMPSTLGRIASFGRVDQRPHFKPAGTTLHDVLGDKVLDSRKWGGHLVLIVAHATIIAEMVDILFERLTPEQRARFEDDGDDGIDPTKGRSVRLDAIGSE